MSIPSKAVKVDDNESLDRLVSLIDLDYQRTSAFIENIVGTGTTVRGWAVTLWLGLLGFAFAEGLWELGLIAAIVTGVLMLVDGYHATLYGQALDHARAAEGIAAMYFSMINHGEDDPDAAEELRIRLAGYRFGLYTNLWSFRLRSVWFARPALFFRLVYPLLIAVAIAAAVLAPNS